VLTWKNQLLLVTLKNVGGFLLDQVNKPVSNLIFAFISKLIFSQMMIGISIGLQQQLAEIYLQWIQV